MNKYLLVLCLSSFSLSCQFHQAEVSNRHIVMGDSSLIVTETDGQYLKNNFDDLTIRPVIESTGTQELVENKVAAEDTVKNDVLPSTQISGYEIKLKNIILILDGKTEKQVRKSAAVSYVVSPRDYPHSVTSMSGEGTIKYRYGAVAYFVKDGQRIKLSQLGEYKSEWKTVKSKNAQFQMPAIDSRPQFKNVSAAELQKAVSSAISSLKISQKEKNKLASNIKKVTALQHSNIEIVVEKVEWDILINNNSDKMFFTF